MLPDIIPGGSGSNVGNDSDDGDSGDSIADQIGGITSPTGGSSPAVESGVRTITSIGSAVAPGSLFGVADAAVDGSDVLDESGDVTPPDERGGDPTVVPEDDGQFFSGATPGEAANDAADQATDVVDSIIPDWAPLAAGGVVALLLGILVLYLLQPLLRIGAGVLGE